MNNLTANEVFKVTNNICLKINVDKVNAEYDDGVTPFNFIDHAVQSHDMLIERASRLEEMVLTLDKSIRKIAESASTSACAGVDIGSPISHTAQMVINAITAQRDTITILRQSLVEMVALVGDELLLDTDSDRATIVFSKAESALDKTK